MHEAVMTIGGKLIQTKHTFGVINPATGRVFAEAPDCSKSELDEAMVPWMFALLEPLRAGLRGRDRKTKRFCAADEAAGIVGARFNLALNGKRFEPCG